MIYGKTSPELEKMRAKGENAYRNAFVMRGLNPDNYGRPLTDFSDIASVQQNAINPWRNNKKNPECERIDKKILEAQKKDFYQLRRKINCL